MSIVPITTRPAATGAGEGRAFAGNPDAVARDSQLQDQAVEPVSQPEPARPDPGRASSPQIDRRFEVDPTTHEVVFQAVDTHSGEIVRQVPEEAMLRLQIYARAMRRGGASARDEGRVERLA